MDFLIADTFADSLTRLTTEEQKVVKTTAFDLQLNPANPGMQFHKLDRAKDKNFWSVRVNRDIRLIVHRTERSLLLCYVDHHDEAYRWAERRKLEQHPTTGAAQLVEIRERVREVEVPQYVVAESRREQPSKAMLLFEGVEDEELLQYGVPTEWLGDVRQATEDSLFDVVAHLPGEAAEALLELATGSKPTPPAPVPPGVDQFAHPDAQRRFRPMPDAKQLARALEYPWEKWTVFLHPAQRDVVGRRYAGPARVAGSAGTGKTIVALHRAVHLASTHPARCVLLTTFSDTLARALELKITRLVEVASPVRERITVSSLDAAGLRLHEHLFGAGGLADNLTVRGLLRTASKSVEEHRFTERFLELEWWDVVDAWQLSSWDEYRSVARLGRKTRVSEKQRSILWSIFQNVRDELACRGLVTLASALARVASELEAGAKAPFDCVVVDEAQDISVPQLRFLAALAGNRPDGLFFAGDLGQRIFQTPFSWRALGVDVRGRSRILRINYRTSHEIRSQADRLLPPEVADVDGNAELRRGVVSAFNGAPPLVRVLSTVEQESQVVAEWVKETNAQGVAPHEIALIVRSPDEVDRARQAVARSGLESVELDGTVDAIEGAVAIATMHLAKGLEFRAVAVVACDDEVLPLQSRIENVADEADLGEVYATERHLLYVACTRARDYLLVTGVEPASEFLEDFA